MPCSTPASIHACANAVGQRVSLTPTYFRAASAMTLLIAVVTVAGQAILVARAPPAKALRHD